MEKNTKMIVILLTLFVSSMPALVQETTKDMSDFPILKGPYLGQSPPGMTAEVFAPGIISTEKYGEVACTFSPDGKEFYFTRHQFEPGTQCIMVSKAQNGRWTKPDIAKFSGKYADLEPHVTPDGEKLFFLSDRPLPGNRKTDENQIWVMEKTEKGWSVPQHHGPGMFVSAALDGTIYFTDMSNWPNPLGIVRSELINGKYVAPVKLEGGVNTPRFGSHPCIAPNESFIIFDSFRDAEKEKGRWPALYVCFRNSDGTWGKAIYLGNEVNHKGSNLGASLSPDGKYLFYSHNNDIYWVDTRIIEKFKPGEIK